MNDSLNQIYNNLSNLRNLIDTQFCRFPLIHQNILRPSYEHYLKKLSYGMEQIKLNPFQTKPYPILKLLGIRDCAFSYLSTITLSFKDNLSHHKLKNIIGDIS